MDSERLDRGDAHTKKCVVTGREKCNDRFTSKRCYLFIMAEVEALHFCCDLKS